MFETYTSQISKWSKRLTGDLNININKTKLMPLNT